MKSDTSSRFWWSCIILFALTHTNYSQAQSFSDDFNRPDSTTVGNGWSDTTGNSANLEIKNNELTLSGSSGGGAGIYHPLDFGLPLTLTATITEETGFGGLLRRYTREFRILNDGVLFHGYGIMIYRGDQNYANSSVRLYDGADLVATEDSTFQYGPELNVSITFNLDGSVTGTVSQPSDVFKFSFGPQAIQSSGGNFSYDIEQGSNGSMDDLSLSAIPEPSTLALVASGLLGAFVMRRRK